MYLIGGSRPTWLSAAIILLLAVGISLLPQEAGTAVIREGGVVETLTVILYLGAIIWLVQRGRLHHQRRWHLSAGFLLLLLALRELDFQARFTTMGVLKSRYYLSPDVPGLEKAIVSLVMITILIIVAHFLYRNTVPFFRALLRGNPAATAIAFACGAAVLSKLLDSFSRPLRQLVGPLYAGSTTYLRVYEEIFELGIPLFILLAIWYAGKTGDRSR